MKTKILCISFVCCLVLQVNAQTTNTIVNDNATWSILSYWCCDGYISTEYYFFDGDTVFNGKTYKKLFRYNDEHHTKRYLSGLMREENQKTYFVPFWNGQSDGGETLLYDFSLEQGDTFEYAHSITGYLHIKQSDSVLINNELKKRLIIADGIWTRDTIIENIGSLQGLLQPPYYMLYNSRATELLCYTQNNELIYRNSKYTQCYYGTTTSVEIMESNNCNIFPNPVDNILNISCLNSTTMRIEIFDNAGRQVYNQAYNESVDVSSFSKGLYLLKLYDANGQVFEFKFIKK
ncbi:MAG: T9SS type A sorting domain-containing protein [Bacteroidetes bacterium]|nr:T9SS type A sorting domain-containing protein [Bacteroidota bacterium]